MITLLRKIRVALTPRSWLLKSKLANGALVYGNNRAGFGGRGIYVYRDSIEPEFPHLEQFLDPNGVFVDVGANTGIYTIKAAKHYSNNGGLVLAIEPFIDVLAVLFHNIQVNNFTNVKLYNFCAAERTGSATLWRNFDKPNSFGLIQRDKKATSLPTLTVTLDDLFDWEGLDRLDYLKIDAEGSEQQVLLGAKRIVEKYRPIIQMEININDVPVNLTNYSVFHAPQSANKVCIPNEHSKRHLPKQFGWGQVA
jgi:FkbM family methyltransferase